MSSKMREALQEAYRRGFSHAREGRLWHDSLENADEIISRYGDLEFTWEEMRGMLKETFRIANPSALRYGLDDGDEGVIDQILSRHLGESESGDEGCCCTCEEPEHSRESYGERCLKCRKHRPPNGKVNFVDEYTPYTGNP